MPEDVELAFTAEEGDAHYRGYLLHSVFGADTPIEIDGVTFDLRCELDASLWRPLVPLGTYGRHRASLHAPRIIFPWTPDDWRESLKDEDAIDAPAGSRIIVAFVEAAPVDTGFGEFEAPESRERQLMHLYVGTPDGELRFAQPPLVLIAETATAIQIDQDDDAKALRGLITKLEQAVGLEDLESMLQEPMDGWRRPTRAPVPSYGRAFFALHRALNGDEQAYASFGYMMARAEAEELMLESAARDQKVSKGRAKGGAKVHVKSLPNTEPLRAHAARIIAEDEDISLTKCAQMVAAIVAVDPAWTMSSDVPWIADKIRDQLFEPCDGPGRRKFRAKRPEAQG